MDLDEIVSAFQTAFDEENDEDFADLCHVHDQPLVRNDPEPFTYPIVGPAIHIQRIKIFKISSLCSLWSEGFLGIAIYSLRGRCRTLRVIFVEVDVVAKHQNQNHRSVASVLLLGRS
ncbi:hypothetical protein CYMTET_19981 [Cymbomonas tetramitiformis]|uniref:Uncharacterized protein n=1 Tax=Cymbomonas tetramitiformis TaxID=36881 RepID=A0AAE0L4R8_9CHLO|nr:hypothetical protein CYMTET_19981 [Cymbomonas tetramitiformis]